jgi:dTDP-4-dehydrorhamnose reductase
MKLLITGANGLLGQKLVHALGAHPEISTLATGLGSCRIQNPPSNVAYQTCDLSIPEEVEKVFSKFRPDVVVHAAAMTNVDTCELNPAECRKQNVTATRHVIQSCEALGAHLIHLSTDFIFDGTSGPYVEEDLPNPISVYGESKLEAEKLVQNSTCPWAIVRTILVYGIAPGLSRSNIILWVKSSLEQGKEIQVVDDQFRTPTLAEDLADGCLRIATQKATGVFHISGKDFLTPYAMAMKTAAYFGLDSGKIKKASAATFSQPARRPPKTGFKIEKARKVLGYEPHSFEEGIRILEKQILPS